MLEEQWQKLKDRIRDLSSGKSDIEADIEDCYRDIADESMDKRVDLIHRVLSLHRRTSATMKSLQALKTLLSTLQQSCLEVIGNKRKLTVFADLSYKPI
jgi:uncharacterized protein (UPF0335 family)